MNIHEQAVSSTMLSALKHVGPFAAANNFYLAGGTALALMFGHRQSVDLDWFSTERIAHPDGIGRALEKHAGSTGAAFGNLAVSPGTIYCTINGVRISMMEYGYPMLSPPAEIPALGCRFASLDDIACMKLAAIASRGARKDFVDIFALLRAHKDLPTIIELYRKKYPVDSLPHAIYSLSYFEDAEREPMPSMLWDVDWNTVKETVLAATKSLTLRNQ